MTKNILMMFAVLFMCVSSANALTPDGIPPSAETVCDSEPAPGRGLCVAYCEAMDCDSDPNANANACARVKSNWQNKTGGTDLPCEMACPCNDIPEYAAYISGATTVGVCTIFLDEDLDGDVIVLSSEDFASDVLASIEEPECGFLSDNFIVVLPLTTEEATFCFEELRAVAEEQVVCEEIPPIID